MRYLLTIGFFFFMVGVYSQHYDTPVDQQKMWKMIKSEMPEFKKVFKKYKNHRLEIIYTRIDRNTENYPTLSTYHFGDSISYFYPASTVKFPMALFTLEKLVSLYGPSSTEYKIKFDSVKVCGNYYYPNYFPIYHRVKIAETLAEFAKRNHLPVDYLIQLNPGLVATSNLEVNTTLRVSKQLSMLSFSDLLQAMLVFSDNESFNKLYDFVGPEFVNFRIKENYLLNNWITRRLLVCDKEERRTLQGFTIYKNDTTPVKYFASQKNDDVRWFEVPHVKVGKGVMVDGKIQKGSKDFTGHNRWLLKDLHQYLIRLVFHHIADEKKKYRFGLFEQRSLIRYLGLYPRETNKVRDSIYQSLNDSYTNFLLYGGAEKNIPSGIRIINVTGQAYGFTSDCAYVMDNQSKCEFFLSARLYTNKNEILNDDQYEYEELAQPFLKKLGEVLLNYERNRKREVVPNLVVIDGIFR